MFSSCVCKWTEELQLSGGGVELAPTLLSAPLEPEAPELQSGLPAGFPKRGALCDWSVGTGDYHSCVCLQPPLME